MFPIFGWTPGFARAHPAIPRFDAPATRPEQASADTDRRREEDHGRHRRSAPASGAVRADEGDDADMSEYREFTGKTVEEALRQAREAFGAELNDLDFEILTPGSRGVLGMGAEPARIVAAPRAALGGAAPKREAAAAVPLPPAPPRPPREDRPYEDRGPRRDDRAPRRDDRPRRRPARADDRPRDDRPRRPAPAIGRRAGTTAARAATTGRVTTGRRVGTIATAPPPVAVSADLSASEAAEVAAAARGSLAAERADLEAAEASPEALASGKAILETLMGHLGFDVRVEVETGETSRLNVVADGDEKEALGALIGRKGERLSALQHLVNLMLSKEIGDVDAGPRRRRGLSRPARTPAPRARRPGRRTCRRDREDAPARADVGPRAPLDPPRVARPSGDRDAVDRRGAEPARRAHPARRRLTDLAPIGPR